MTHKEEVIQCQYCGMSEREVCSPLVIGQTRDEHDAWIEICSKKQLLADSFYGKQKGTVVSFLYAENEFPSPSIVPPYFPPYHSPETKTLLEYYETVNQSPIVAHQLCCLQLFQARVNRSKHALRRRRKAVGNVAVMKTGLSVQPLGNDSHGLEYWKFPFSLDLFILEASSSSSSSSSMDDNNEDNEAFNRAIGKSHLSLEKKSSFTAVATDGRVWRRVNTTSDIKTIVELLNDCSCNEKQLKSNIYQFLLNERIANELKHDQSNAALVAPLKTEESKDSSSDNEMKEDDDERAGGESMKYENSSITLSDSNEQQVGRQRKSLDGSHNIPVAIRLFPSKGNDIPSTFIIQEERVFDDSLPEDIDDDGSGEDDYYQYFTFSGKK
jgi:hypothetical protein